MEAQTQKRIELRPQGRFWRFAGRYHQQLYRWTGGKIGSYLGGDLRALLLTTTGRKTGMKRTVPLPFTPIGETPVIVASICGSDNDPAWSLNLKADPEVEIQIMDEVRKVRADQATEEERQELWPKIVAHIPQLEGFQKLTERRFPIYILRPR